MSEGVLFSDPYRSLDIIAGPTSPNALAVMQRDKADGVVSDADGLADPFRTAASAPSSEPTPPRRPLRPPRGGARRREAAPGRSADRHRLPPRRLPRQPQRRRRPKPRRPPPRRRATSRRRQRQRPRRWPVRSGPNHRRPRPRACKRCWSCRSGRSVSKQLGPAIDVKATDEGLLITLTDKLNYSMFALGSAEPQPKVIQAMDAARPSAQGARRPGRGARPHRCDTPIDRRPTTIGVCLRPARRWPITC